MSKKHHSSAGKYLNPPFDPRILQVGPPNERMGSKKLVRGRLVSATADVSGAKHGVHFLYNPVAVNVSHNISDQIVNGANFGQTGGETGQMGTTVNIGGTSIDLLYDRTYELWDHSKRNTLAGRFGVYADVLAFYFLLGITASGETGGAGNSAIADMLQQNGLQSGNTTVWQSLYPQNPISANTLLYLYIGDKMRFYGILTSFAITYSHWSREMIPMRCQVSLSLQFQVDPKTATKKINRKHLHPTSIPGSGH
jgi:hypothetical protein